MDDNDELRELRKLCDPTIWPKDYILHEGEVYQFVTDDPLEERIVRALRSGRFQ
jgi:hypothetical protein